MSKLSVCYFRARCADCACVETASVFPSSRADTAGHRRHGPTDGPRYTSHDGADGRRPWTFGRPDGRATQDRRRRIVFDDLGNIHRLEPRGNGGGSVSQEREHH